MNLKITASTLILYLSSFALFAQDGNPCRRDYSLLSYPIRIELGNIQKGQQLFINDTYLTQLASGAFDHKKSEVRYYQYLRPATKKEMKFKALANEDLIRVFGDGNVYSLEPLPSQFHFFSPRPGFEGSLAGTWEDPFLILPMGLEPINSKRLTDILMTVLESTPDYLLLEGEGNTYVFYPGYPEVSEVFIGAEATEQLNSRQAMAESLVGNRYFLQNHPSLRFRKVPSGENMTLPDNSPGIEVQVHAAYSFPNEVLLRCNDEQMIYIVLDEFSKFTLSDLECLESENAMRWEHYEDTHTTANKELNEALRSGKPVVDLLENEWIISLLQDRFRLHQDLDASVGEYECLYLKDKEAYLHSFLLAHVDQEGNIYLQSQYSSDRGLYHTKIELVIQDQDARVSDRIMALDPRNVRIRKQGRVIEEIHFKGDADNGILEAIAMNADKEIQVRFVAGGMYFKDMVLLPKYKDAIRDAWLLSQYLKNQEVLNARIRGDK